MKSRQLRGSFRHELKQGSGSLRLVFARWIDHMNLLRQHLPVWSNRIRSPRVDPILDLPSGGTTQSFARKKTRRLILDPITATAVHRD